MCQFEVDCIHFCTEFKECYEFFTMHCNPTLQGFGLIGICVTTMFNDRALFIKNQKESKILFCDEEFLNNKVLANFAMISDYEL